jgi:hypothetical protein
MEAQGIPIYRGIGVRRVQDMPLKRWERMGGNGTFIQLYGTRAHPRLYPAPQSARVPGGRARRGASRRCARPTSVTEEVPSHALQRVLGQNSPQHGREPESSLAELHQRLLIGPRGIIPVKRDGPCATTRGVRAIADFDSLPLSLTGGYLAQSQRLPPSRFVAPLRQRPRGCGRWCSTAGKPLESRQ